MFSISNFDCWAVRPLQFTKKRKRNTKKRIAKTVATWVRPPLEVKKMNEQGFLKAD
jgi:hypothetical protein